jgi:cell shape-determining protein MreC
MKMRYLPNKDRDRDRSVAYILVAIIIAIIFYWWNPFILSFFGRIAFGASYPFWKVQSYLVHKTSSFLINFDKKIDLENKNKYLINRYESTKYSLMEIDFIRKENIELKKILGKRKVDEEGRSNRNLLAYILSGPATPPYDALILDLGEDDGVSVGDLVLSSNGYLVGEIIEISDKLSKVRLNSSYGIKTSVFIGENKTMMEIIGIGSGNFVVQIPKDFLVEEGGLALMPGEDFTIVAEVKKIEGKDGEMFKRAYLFSPFNIKELRSVLIISKKI